jgi:uncharacterized protein YbjT (DUF2867 family)
MGTTEVNVVTGAFSFTGKYITQRLLSMGKKVITLTSRVERENTFDHQVKAFSFNFDKPGELTDSLRGADTLYNTYWIRFPYGEVSFDKAVENSRTLITAAGEAGIRRIVYISITNPSESSPFPYFKGKALVEKAITQSKLSHAIVRPTVIFGLESILINNIAWLLRKFPIFAVPGSGDYQIQPVFVEDVADMAINVGQQDDDVILDAVGPETFTFDELVRMIASQINSRAKIVHVGPGVVLFLAKLISYVVKDVVITRDEIEGLMANLLVSKGEKTAATLFSDWLYHNAGKIGTGYTSGLRRSYC